MRRLALLSLCAGLAAAPLSAQAQEGVDWGGLMMGIAHGTAMDEAAREGHSRTQRRSSATRPPAPSPKPTPTADAVARLAYRPSLERRRANLADFVRRTRARDPAGAAELEKLFAQGDIIARMQAVVGPQGVRLDNLADAYAIWWIDAWHAAKGRPSPSDARQVAVVRRQAAQRLLADPTVAAADDAERQRMAESYLVQTLILESLMDHGAKNPAFRQATALAARQGARGVGLDLDAYELTAAGFTPRR